ncbi:MULTISPECIES: DUF1513 domain-containing protein [unclassified Roseovarius]|uniref:DUF1513 domain-containing protein n=1 Tax=unclassified Roseovarius TaxID=2614913 RepID=UPI00273F6EE6|nr:MULTISPECIES: DUF1513 domain-containing protein [unclassified Roseovarius]
MTTRRHFLAGLLATGLAPRPGWAEAGDPAYLSAARLPSGEFALIGLNRLGVAVFKIPLPGRGHAAAAHPTTPLAVAFARRPGRFALVVDCLRHAVTAQLDAPEGRHFYGHGAFSGDGRYLFTSENDYDAARGMVGVWDGRKGFRRVGEFSSAGVGPHDLRMLPDGETLVVANGGIETHPEWGRAKLNLPEMRPNLSYLSLDGTVLEQQEPPAEWHLNSMRHLTVSGDGQVAVACQWQGDPAGTPPLVATHRRGQSIEFHPMGNGMERDMQGYVGSVAFAGDGRSLAFTGPREGIAGRMGADGQMQARMTAPDICGVAPQGQGFVFTTGVGEVLQETAAHRGQIARHDVAWDNHLIPVG